MKRTHTLRCRTEKYKDRQTGQEKQGYMTVGHVLEKPDGTVMLKIDSLPIGFDGWLFHGELPTQNVNQTARPGEPAPAQRTQIEDDVPF